jgi:hypothetical protein
MQALLHKEAEAAESGVINPLGKCPTCRKPINRSKKGHITPLVFNVKQVMKLVKIRVKKGSEEWKEAMRRKAEREGEDVEKTPSKRDAEESKHKNAGLMVGKMGETRGGVKTVDLTGEDDEWDDDDIEFGSDGPVVKRRMGGD